MGIASLGPYYPNNLFLFATRPPSAFSFRILHSFTMCCFVAALSLPAVACIYRAEYMPGNSRVVDQSDTHGPYGARRRLHTRGRLNP